MNDSPNVDTNEVPSRNSRRLWPWVLGVVVLGLCAFGASTWQKYHHLRQLREFAENSFGGRCEIEYNHPPWADHIVSPRTYLPWCDGISSYSALDTPLSDKLFGILLQQRTLRSLEINISECSPESIAELGRLKRLESVDLTGNGQEIPLEWAQGLVWLDKLTFHNILVPPKEWPRLLSLSHVSGMNWSKDYTHVSDFASTPYLMIKKDHLTLSDADALAAVKGLGALELTYIEADPEFWERLGLLPSLVFLQLTKTGSAEFELSQIELEALIDIATLESLRLVDHVDLSALESASPAWQKFATQRPDVKVNQHFSDRPE